MTPAKPSLSVLLVNEHAEEIKLISTSLRGFFPDCRVEAVYTSEEALLWSLRDDWHLLLVEDALAPRSGIQILHELKRNCPHAAIILQTDPSDSATALQALQQGADFLLFRNSPGFVTELLFYAQDAIEKRELEIKLEHTFQRYLRLVESVSDVVYELDQEGRFIYVSPTVTSLLGYAPEDLSGQHFSMLLPPTQDHIARYRVNERRAGTRSAYQLELYMLSKASAKGKSRRMLMQLTAKGLYDERHQYLGTVGLLRDLSAQRQQASRLQDLEIRLQEADRQLAASRDATLASQHLQQPLSALLQGSQQLLTTLQIVRIDQHLRQLAPYETQATELGQEVLKSKRFRGNRSNPVALNSELRRVITELSQERFLHPRTIEQRFGQALPSIVGNASEMRELFRVLMLYALHSLADTPAGARLLLETYALKMADAASASLPALSSLSLSPYVAIVIRQQAGGTSIPIQPMTEHISGSDFLRAHTIVQQHGGSIEISSDFTPAFQITVRLPTTLSPCVHTFPEAMSEPQPAPTTTVAHSPETTRSPDSIAPADRRRFERIRLGLSLELSIGATAWQGRILNLGLGGMFLASAQPTPPIEHQPVYLILRTPVSFLELQGTVRYRSTAFAGEPDRACFVIAFPPLLETDAAVLTSFIQSLLEQSTTLTIEGLIPETTERLQNLPSTLSLQPER